jgi:hypothetical protein
MVGARQRYGGGEVIIGAAGRAFFTAQIAREGLLDEE